MNHRALRAGVNVSSRDYMKATIASRAGVISQPLRSIISGRPIVVVTAPILNAAGNVVAVMIGSIDLERDNFLAGINHGKVGRTGYFYAVTADGIFISHPVAERILQSALPLLPRSPALAAALRGFEGTVESSNNRDVNGLFSFKRMQSTKWIVASVFPAAEAYAPIERTENKALVTALLLALIAGPLAWRVTSRQLAPLDRLAQRIDAVRQDPSMVVLPQLFSDDELGRLARSFDDLMRERLFAETKYQTSAEELRAATDGILDAFFILQAERDGNGAIIDFRFRYLNENGARLLNLPRDDVQNQRLCELLPINRTAGFFDKYVKVLETGIALQEEFPFSSPDIDATWLSHQVTPLVDGVAIATRDISQRKRDEIELHANRAFLQSLIDHLPVLVFSKTVSATGSGRFTLWNKAAEKVVGLDASHVIGKTSRQIFSPETAQIYDDNERAIIGNHQPVDVPHHPLRRPDGTQRVLHTQVLPMLNAAGEVDQVLGIAEDITERRAAHAALEFSEQRLRLVTDNLPALVAYIDADERYQFCNAFYSQSQQMEPADMLGKSIRELFGYRWYAVLEPYITAALRGEHQSFEHNTETKHGQRHLQYEYIPDVRPGGMVAGFYSMVTDITARNEMEQALLAEKERLRVTLNSIGDAVITTDVRSIVSYLNPAAERMTGWSAAEAVGVPLAQVFQTVAGQAGSVSADPVAMVIASGAFNSRAGSVFLVARDGSQIAIEDSASPIRDASDAMVGVVMVFHDVSQAHVMAEQMSHLAAHDALTGLLNRREFERRLELAVASAIAGDRQHTVLYLDLDQFKVVNDTCGHVAGDELLRQLTVVLLDCLRQNDVLARLGGDEFGVLLENCPASPASRIADLLRKTVSEFHFVWLDKVFPIGVSIGLVTFSNGGITMPDVLRMADSACYVAKDKGRNRVHVFTEENEELAHRHGQMSWIARIQQALDHNRFVLYCQPMMALDVARHGSHYELLLRMLDDDDQVIPPMAFIPAAERYGLMPLLDRWVIRHAFESHAPRHRPDAPPGTCAINLSGTSISDETFLPFLMKQFAQSRVPPSEICFEITETAAIANLGQAAVLIRELKAIGCKFSLDDFGSGMSSFTYLKHLPVDFLKIDGSFVKDMIDDPIDRAMVESINHIGHVMGLSTIAEFVESPGIILALREIGVDYAQGYAIGRPQPC